MKFPIVVALSSGISFLGAGGYAILPTAITDALNPSCKIKGNISIGSGERIFHVPGQHYYVDTVIRPEYGERWFCTEAEARSAGWRKAGY